MGRFFRWLWSLARLFPSVAPGIRFGGGASVLLSFLFFVFVVVAVVLVALGFDLGQVDDWLDRNAGIFDKIGTILFKGLLVFILAICALVVGAVIHGWFAKKKPGQSDKDQPGGCMFIAAIVIGYVCVVGIFSL